MNRTRERQTTSVSPEAAGDDLVPYVAVLYREGLQMELPMMEIRAQSIRAAARQAEDEADDADFDWDQIHVYTLH